VTTLRGHVRDFAVRHVGGTAVVLIYHRVAALERDPQLLAVTPENFDAQMRMITENHRVVSLEELTRDVRRNRVPNRAVAVTFDDGYADNLTTAEPILSARRIPATVFVSSGYVAQPREFWWDELERVLLGPGALPERIELRAGASVYVTQLEDSLQYSEEDAQRDRGWTVLDAPGNARQRVYVALNRFVRPLSAEVREDALHQLRGLAGLEPSMRPTHRPLSEREVRDLDSSQLVDIGAHTLHHPVLSARSLAEQRNEILNDRDALASMCGRPMRTFSYPYGGLTDYSEETVAIVRGAGFDGACSNHPGIVKPWTDAYRLPRCVVRDWDANTLAEKLEGWFDGSL